MILFFALQNVVIFLFDGFGKERECCVNYILIS